MDFDKALKAFEKYVSNFDEENGKILLKKRHTYGVVKISEYIAKGLNLSEEDIFLSKIIALLHDIGRFEQVRKSNNFGGVAHADLGVEILKENNFIREFISISKFDDIIYAAILNHSKLTIEDGLDSRSLLHAKIIRDADKVDNFRVKSFDDFESVMNSSLEILEKSHVSEDTYKKFMTNKSLIFADTKTPLDVWLFFLAFTFDINFSDSLVYIKNKNYINLMIDRIDYKDYKVKEMMENVRLHLLQYIENRLVENEKC